MALEIDAAEITASAFTVEIISLPKNDMPANEFKAHLWQWIEDFIKSNTEPLLRVIIVEFERLRK